MKKTVAAIVIAIALTITIPCAAPTLAAQPTMRAAVASPAQRAAVRKVLHCLNALSDTGASADAVAETRDLIIRLEVGNQRFARDLSGLLMRVLSCKIPHPNPLLGKERETQVYSLPGFPGIPRDLIDRAAAACATRADRKSGDIVQPSRRARSKEGVLINDYQPKPVFGGAADRIAALVLARSAGLKFGVKRIAYLRLW